MFSLSQSPRPSLALLQFARGAALLGMALSILGCAESIQPPGGSPPPLSPSATISFCDSRGPSCAAATSFQLNSLRDLNVIVDWQNVPAGTHAQTVSFYLPTGDLYQAFEKSFAVSEGSSDAVTTVQALPVEGTWLAQRSAPGTWQVTVALDGQVLESQSVQLTR